MKETTETGLAPAEIRQQLGRILAHPLFSGARRQSQFLQFIVDRTVEGNASEIKESLIGVEVYGREPSYDPKSDSIVRAEASRLRAKLREYYDTAGRNDPLRIDLPKGNYTPSFHLNSSGPVPEPPRPPERVPSARFPWRWAGVAGVVVLLGAVGLFWRWPQLGVRLSGAHKAHTIAVMPPVNLGPDRSNDSLGETLADELTRALVDSSEWKVAGRAPTIDQTGRDQMLTWLRQNLHADFVLTGSYRVGENSLVRLSLQLVDLTDGSLVWTQTYSQRLAYLAESQNEFVRNVVLEITGKTGKRPSEARARNPANERARQYYTQAREHWSRYTERDLEQSLKLFQQAVQADPGYALAWAGLADANVRLSTPQDQPIATRAADARAAALKAISLDAENGEAHAALGWILLVRDWRFRAGALEFERATELDPIRVFPHIYYSQALTILGDFAGAQTAIEAARARLPPIPEVLFQQGSVYFLSGNTGKLEALGRDLLALQPDGAPGYWLVGLALEERGKTPQAIAEFQAGLARDPKDLRTLCALSHAYGLAGNRAQAFETARRYIDLNQKEITRNTLSYCAALVYTALGRKDQAFEWLEKARAGRDNSFPFLRQDPRFGPLKSDPRFKALADWLDSIPQA